MLKIGVSWVKPEQVESLREWFSTMQGPRRDEVLETFVEEGMQHEKVLFVETSDGPIMVYVMNMGDQERAETAFANSNHPLDHDHKAALAAANGGVPAHEVVLDIHLD